jgi:hypothetical protein
LISANRLKDEKVQDKLKNGLLRKFLTETLLLGKKSCEFTITIVKQPHNRSRFSQ